MPRGLGSRGFPTDEEKENKPKVTKALLLRILSYLRPYWPQFLLVFAAILLSAACPPFSRPNASWSSRTA